MSSTKSPTEEHSDFGGEQKSSKDILNELFSTFNTSFDESSSSKKKKKKSKKKRSKKDHSSDDDEESESPSPEKKKKDKRHHGGKKRSKEEAEDDVEQMIKKHRKSVKEKVFSGLVSNIGDIVINNDELIKSKSRKREEDLRKAAGVHDEVEDGEIPDDSEVKVKAKKKKDKKERLAAEYEEDGVFAQKKRHSKLSASQAYKLDVEEKLLSELEPIPSSKSSRHSREKERESSSSRSSRSRPESRTHSDRSHSGDHRDNGSSSSSYSSSRHPSDRRKSADGRQQRVEEGVRHAPPRDRDSRDGGSDPASSARLYYKVGSYKEAGWQKERDHYDFGGSSRRRDYNVDNYYERETSRRCDGRSGFGFADRTYYDEPVDRPSERRNYSNHDDRRSPSPRRGRSRRSRSRSPYRWRRSRSRSSERRRHPDDIIDKAKLLEIARKNAAKLMRRGCLPTDIFSRDQIVAIRAGGKSVEELTDYCHRLAKKDARGDAISDDSDGEGEQFIHHPFHVKDRPLPQITLNIRNAIPIPVRTPQELAIEGAKLKTVFPVSSGTQHRIKELEWHPVDKEEEEKKAKAAEDLKKALVPLDGPQMVPAPGEEPAETAEESNNGATTNGESGDKDYHEISLEPPAIVDFDISDVIAIRLKAMRQLSENPNSDEAKKQLDDATKMMKNWANSKAHEPKFLTQSELTQGPQAWAKRDQLTKAKEVQSPMGLHLLQKMGWKPGEGLGKFKAGDVEPLALEVKTDKKGLTSILDFKKGPAMPLVYDLSGKHPISALMELCAKRKWGSPDFDLVFEHGPSHQKQFVYKVVVNGVEYQPCVAVNNKKLAKANAAAFCLQSLGLLPTAMPASADDTLRTVPQPPPAAVPPPLMSLSNAPHHDNRSISMGKFTPGSHYLQTVPSSGGPLSQNAPPLPPESLMPPPPPPPPLAKMK